MSVPSIIEIEALSHRVALAEQEISILEGIALDVKEGESVALLGHSGSGKSTLLGLIAGLDQPLSGQIRIAGQTLGSMDEEARARLRGDLIGFIFQSFQLLPALTALENVMLPAEIRGLTGAETQARHWLEAVGLAHRLHHRPTRLSGGEQQRVAIARAFMGQPRLLLCDEPTGNLDPATGRQVAELLFRLNAEQGTSLLVVTHDETLAQRCQRRLWLQDGRLSPTPPVHAGVVR